MARRWVAMVYVYAVKACTGDVFKLVPCPCVECYKWVDFEY